MSNPQQTHFFTWCKGQVQIMLGISPDESSDIVNSWVKLSDKELDATLKGFLGDTDQVKRFYTEFLSRRRQAGFAVPASNDPPQPQQSPAKQTPAPKDEAPEGFVAYRKGDKDSDSEEDSDSDDDGKKKKGRKSKKDKQQNYTVVANPYSRKGPQIMVVKKKNKQVQGAKKEYKRIPCTCQAREHPLINNCLKCGKIVCEQEGPGPCFFCGSYVLPRNATPEEIEAAKTATQAEQKMSMKEREGLQKAEEHRNKLLEYERDKVRRTIIYDDQSDYYNMNAKWLSPEERDAAIKKQEEIRRQREENKYKITIDFAGRKIISDQDLIEEENKRFQDEIIRLKEEFQPRHGSDFRKPAPAPSAAPPAAEKKGSSPSPAQKTQAQASVVPDDRSEHDESFVSTNIGTYFNPHVKMRPKFVKAEGAEEYNPNEKVPIKSLFPLVQLKANKAEKAEKAKEAKVSRTKQLRQAKLANRVQHELFGEQLSQFIDFDQIAKNDTTDLSKTYPVRTVGVVEGYYGQPYTMTNRKKLITWMSKKKANYYIWAPKEDPYHRVKWRDLFPKELVKEFKDLVAYSKQQNIAFNMAIHPWGIKHGDVKDFDALCAKLHQVYEEIGCNHITILFDDIGLDLPEDFSSLVDAQAFTMNKLIKYFDAFIANKTLTEKVELKSIEWTTCPTYYSCKFKNNSEVPAVNYLTEFKEKMDQRVVFLWTGETTISKTISLDLLKRTRGFFGPQRRLVIWDNTPVNDYRMHIQFLNPYMGRDEHIGAYVDGVLLNPMESVIASTLNLGTAFDFFVDPKYYHWETCMTNTINELTRNSQTVTQALFNLIEIAPGNDLFVKHLPKFIFTSSPEEQKWIASLKQDMTEVDKADFPAKAELKPFLDLTRQFLATNTLYFEWYNDQTSDVRLQKLVAALRQFEVLLFPHIRALEQVQAYKKATIERIVMTDDKSKELQKCVNTLHKQMLMLTQQTKASDKFWGSPYHLKRNTLADEMITLIREIDAHLRPLYDTDDIYSLMFFMNSVFLTGNFDLKFPTLVTPAKIFKMSAIANEKQQAAKAAAAPVVENLKKSAVRPKPVTTVNNLSEIKVPGLGYVPEWLSRLEEKKILQLVDNQEWDMRLARRTQHYGWEYDYFAPEDQEIDAPRLKFLGQLPEWLAYLAERLHADKLAPFVADQVIINEYTPGQGINPHIDHKASFEGCVISITLESGAVMDFKHYQTEKMEAVYLEPRSAVVLQGEARYQWSHGIEARRIDTFAGVDIPRGRRVSLTFRKAKEEAVKMYQASLANANNANTNQE